VTQQCSRKIDQQQEKHLPNGAKSAKDDEPLATSDLISTRNEYSGLD
jgi:hypothetical protein